MENQSSKNLLLRQKSHSENISPFIDHCLQKSQLTLQDIDVFAVRQGPGSFTGIRIAANAGKTFAYSFNKPMVTLDSFDSSSRTSSGSFSETRSFNYQRL